MYVIARLGRDALAILDHKEPTKEGANKKAAQLAQGIDDPVIVFEATSKFQRKVVVNREVYQVA